MEIRDYENPVPQTGGTYPGGAPASVPEQKTEASAYTGMPGAEKPVMPGMQPPVQMPQSEPRIQFTYGTQYQQPMRPVAEPHPYGAAPGAYGAYPGYAPAPQARKKTHKARNVFLIVLAFLLAFGIGCGLMVSMIYSGALENMVSYLQDPGQLTHPKDEKPGLPDLPSDVPDQDDPSADQPPAQDEAPDDSAATPPAEKNEPFEPVSNAPEIKIVTVEEEGENYREELSIPDIAERATPSVVGVIKYASDDPMDGYGIGSGIIFTEDGYIITNEHVISEAYEIVVLLYDGTEYDAKLIASDADADIAILKIEASGLIPAEFGDSTQLRVGEISVAIGCPASIDLQGTTTSGIISALDRVITVDSNGRTMRLLQTDAAINPGNSGGPLLNKYGQVIGINTVKLVSATYEGLCFAIPTSELEAIVSDLFTYGYVRGFPAIGLTAASVEEGQDDYGVTPSGVVVAEVDPLGGAYGVIEVGDIITHCNGTRIYAVSQINVIKNRMRVGDTITLTVYRKGETFDVGILLKDQYDLRDDY